MIFSVIFILVWLLVLGFFSHPACVLDAVVFGLGGQEAAVEFYFDDFRSQLEGFFAGPGTAVLFINLALQHVRYGILLFAVVADVTLAIYIVAHGTTILAFLFAETIVEILTFVLRSAWSLLITASALVPKTCVLHIGCVLASIGIFILQCANVIIHCTTRILFFLGYSLMITVAVWLFVLAPALYNILFEICRVFELGAKEYWLQYWRCSPLAERKTLDAKPIVRLDVVSKKQKKVFEMEAPILFHHHLDTGRGRKQSHCRTSGLGLSPLFTPAEERLVDYQQLKRSWQGAAMGLQPISSSKSTAMHASVSNTPPAIFNFGTRRLNSRENIGHLRQIKLDGSPRHAAVNGTPIAFASVPPPNPTSTASHAPTPPQPATSSRSHHDFPHLLLLRRTTRPSCALPPDRQTMRVATLASVTSTFPLASHLGHTAPFSTPAPLPQPPPPVHFAAAPTLAAVLSASASLLQTSIPTHEQPPAPPPPPLPTLAQESPPSLAPTAAPALASVPPAVTFTIGDATPQMQTPRPNHTRPAATAPAHRARVTARPGSRFKPRPGTCQRGGSALSSQLPSTSTSSTPSGSALRADVAELRHNSETRRRFAGKLTALLEDDEYRHVYHDACALFPNSGRKTLYQLLEEATEEKFREVQAWYASLPDGDEIDVTAEILEYFG
ncbi:hypothetical protein HDU93_000066 [Gonapodya sp. JEL0774]|nr:hypothetical protein HDU93_000066 [Gonapodya sp. JEL0774]